MDDREREAWLDLECAEVSYLLRQVGIDHLFLKGSFALESLGLTEPATSVDVDVLVDQDDLRRAGAALLAHGYRDVLAGTRPGEVAGHSRVYRRGFGPEIDLHWTYPGVQNATALWPALRQRSVSVSRAGCRVPTMGRDGHLLVLALTSAREGPDSKAAARLRLLSSPLGEALHRLALIVDATDALQRGLAASSASPSAGAVPGPAEGWSREVARAQWAVVCALPRWQRALALLSEVFPSPAFMRLMSGWLGGGALPVLYAKRWWHLLGLVRRSMRWGNKQI